MEKKEKAPVLRFKDTNGKDYPAWEQRELKDVAEIVGGGTPSTSVPAYWNGSIDWYSPTEIGQENFAKGSKRKISNEGLNNSSAKLLPAHKTILFTSRATIGEAAILEREGATNQGFQSIVTKEGVDVYFLYSYKHHLKKQALIKASGSTFLEISKNEVEGLHVPVPSGEEQAKIGSFFKLVDKAITLHQRKLEALKKLKRTLLQKMFPKKDQLNPELRFPGFTNDWEQRKLEDCAAIIMGQSPKSENYTNDPKDHVLVQGNADLKNGQVVPRVWTTEVTKVGKVGDIILSVRAPVGEVGKTAFDVVLGRGVAAIRGNDFLLQTLQKFKECKYWGRVSAGSTFDSITSEILKSTVISMPTIEEQIKIGDFLSSVDNLITLHQRKLETYKKLKKGLLQKMFI